LSQTNTDLSLACELNWKDGLMLCIAYSVYEIFKLFYTSKKRNILRDWIIILALYIFIYGAMSPGYIIVSFFQKSDVNSLIHTFLALFLFDLVLRITSYKNHTQQTDKSK
jgi:hypothetical protein